MSSGGGGATLARPGGGSGGVRAGGGGGRFTGRLPRPPVEKKRDEHHDRDCEVHAVRAHVFQGEPGEARREHERERDDSSIR